MNEDMEFVKQKEPTAYCAPNDYHGHSKGLNFCIKYKNWMGLSEWKPTEAEAWQDAAARIRLREGVEQVPVEEKFHFEDEDVLNAMVGTEYLKTRVSTHLHTMTSGEKWSLYRAIVKLVDEKRQHIKKNQV